MTFLKNTDWPLNLKIVKNYEFLKIPDSRTPKNRKFLKIL